jgi:hypothetical protein
LNLKIAIILILAAAMGLFIAAMFKQAQEKIALVALSSSSVEPRLIWEKKIFKAGATSPAVGNFGPKGNKGIIIVGGKLGVVRGPRVTCMDGTSGRILWQQEVDFELTLQPTILDINDDKVDDIILAGDSNRIEALDGGTGRPIWTFTSPNRETESPSEKWTFSRPVTTSDSNGDGVKNLIAVQGRKLGKNASGNSSIFLISGRTGELIKAKTITDDGESWANPTYYPTNSGNRVVIKLHNGQKLTKVLALDAIKFSVLWQYDLGETDSSLSFLVGVSKGIGESRLGVSTGANGTITGFNPDTGKPLWAWGKPDIKILAPPAFGNFNSDNKLDLVVSLTSVKPDGSTEGKTTWIDGRDGKFLHQKVLGFDAKVSPLTVDFDGDGLDEVITGTNTSANGAGVLSIFDGSARASIRTIKLRAAISATPAVIDVDGNHILDLIVVLDGMVQRYEIGHSPKPVAKWSQVHGPQGTGTYMESVRGAAP